MVFTVSLRCGPFARWALWWRHEASWRHEQTLISAYPTVVYQGLATCFWFSPGSWGQQPYWPLHHRRQRQCYHLQVAAPFLNELHVHVHMVHCCAICQCACNVHISGQSADHIIKNDTHFIKNRKWNLPNPRFIGKISITHTKRQTIKTAEIFDT